MFWHNDLSHEAWVAGPAGHHTLIGSYVGRYHGDHLDTLLYKDLFYKNPLVSALCLDFWWWETQKFLYLLEMSLYHTDIFVYLILYPLWCALGQWGLLSLFCISAPFKLCWSKTTPTRLALHGSKYLYLAELSCIKEFSGSIPCVLMCFHFPSFLYPLLLFL